MRTTVTQMHRGVRTADIRRQQQIPRWPDQASGTRAPWETPPTELIRLPMPARLGRSRIDQGAI